MRPYKYQLLLAICLGFGITGLGQGGVSEVTVNTGGSYPADQVFLHSDRGIYYPGDTIRFQAYIRDRQTGIFETHSRSLYALLIDQNSKVIDSARFRIQDATASGWLNIPDTVPAGHHAVVSFTSSMMNYNPSCAFTLPVEIETAQTFLKKSDQGSSARVQTHWQLHSDPDSIHLAFLPEGGSFISGFRQRLAFNAVSSSGSTIFVEGEIRNQNGERVSGFKSGEYGPGIVEFEPLPGELYFAALNGLEYDGIKWPLPEPVDIGVAIRMKESGEDTLVLEIRGQEVSGTLYNLVLEMNDVAVLSRQFRLDSIFDFKVNTGELPAGTALFTLYDSLFRPVAERPVFVNGHRNVTVEVESLEREYSRGDHTEFKISILDSSAKNVGSVLSIAVIDSASGYNPSIPPGDIFSYMLFDRIFYNNLPGRVKNIGLSNLSYGDIDLLLMTYGWNKFREKDEADTIVAREIINYDLVRIKSDQTVKKPRNEINIVAIESSETYSLQLISDEYTLEFGTLDPSVEQIMIMPDRSAVRNIIPVTVEFAFNKDFVQKVKKFKLPVRESDLFLNPTKARPADLFPDSVIMIDPVTIKGTRNTNKRPLNKYESQFLFTDVVTITTEDYHNAVNLEDVIGKLMPYKVDTKNKMVYLTPGRALRNPPPALIVLDDCPLWAQVTGGTDRWLSSYDAVSEMPASNIASVSAIKGPQGFSLYGEAALGGVIFITTRGRAMMEGKLTENNGPVEKNDLAKPIRIYRSEIEYYVPRHLDQDQPSGDPFQPTVFWKNELMMDATGPGTVKYSNNLKSGIILIIINGVTFNNIPFSGTYRYTVN
ncbi:MAG TPA: hypothetical protein PLB27_15425 [Bacteroidales bacterium]|nr:hypothetical protein [Bacteroidales bacterium]